MAPKKQIVTVPKAKHFVDLSPGTTNVNFIDSLPRTINQLSNLLGNDIVLKGLDVEVSIENNTFKATISPGVVLQDLTPIESPDEIQVELEQAGDFDTAGRIVVYAQFHFLQSSGIPAPLRFGVVHVGSNSRTFDHWDPYKNRIVLNMYTFTKDDDDIILTAEEQEEDNLQIWDEVYYKYGYHPGNVTLFRYIHYFFGVYSEDVSGSGGGGTLDDSSVPNDFTVGDDLIVNGKLTVHGEPSTFEGDLNLAKDLIVSGEIKALGRLRVDSDQVEFADNELDLNIGESSAGVSAGYAGFRIDRGTLPDALLRFDESTGTWLAGIEGETLVSITQSGGSGGAGGDIYHTDILDWATAITDAFDDRFGAKTTDELYEGSINKYFKAAHETKLDGIEINANNYIHPSTHPASIIIQDSGHRMVTDTQIATWDAGGGGSYVHPDSHPAYFIDQDSTHRFVSDVQVAQWNSLSGYTHPAEHPATMIVEDSEHRFITDTQVASWDAKLDAPLNDVDHGQLGGGNLHDAATVSQAGFMSEDDKEHLDQLWAGGGAGAIVPATSSTLGGVIIGNNIAVDLDGVINAISQTDENFATAYKIKLDGIANSANNYSHPVSHDPSIITQDTTHRFVTDTQITLWNEGAYTHPTTHDATMIVEDNDHQFVTQTQIDSWDAQAGTYTHPSTHSATMIDEDTTHRFVTDTQIATWDAGGSTYIHPATHSADIIIEQVDMRFMMDAERSKLAGIDDNANLYVHPTNHNASDIVEETDLNFMTDAERTKLSSLINYIHPLTHDATEIEEDITHRFVTDTQIAAWNSASDGGTSVWHNGAGDPTGVLGSDGDYYLNNDNGEIWTKSAGSWTMITDITGPSGSYVHPATHSATMIDEDIDLNFMTDAEQAKLAGIDENANLYVHPTTHDATDILEDTTHRFVTDSQISTWDSGGGSYTHPANHPASMIVEATDMNWFLDAERVKLAGIDTGANNYTHPITHDATDIVEDITHRFVTDVQIASWNSGSVGYTLPEATINDLGGIKVGTGLTIELDGTLNGYVHPTYHSPTVIAVDATHRFVTDTQILEWDAKFDAADFDDTVHGQRSGGPLHALVNGNGAGFMSGTDKDKLDDLLIFSAFTAGVTTVTPTDHISSVEFLADSALTVDGDDTFKNVIYGLKTIIPGPRTIDGNFHITGDLTIDGVYPSTGGGGGTDIAILDEGSSLNTAITALNFIGQGVSVTMNGTQANISIAGGGTTPEGTITVGYNQSTATVADVPMFNRNISEPTAEGSPFMIGDWIVGSTHTATNATTWMYSTADKCQFASTTTTFEVIIYEADGTVQTNFETPAITGDAIETDGNITVTITGWVDNGDNTFSANVEVSLTMSSILPSGGRISVSITHHNSTAGDFVKEQNDVFFDPNSTIQSIGSVFISQGVLSSTKYLSGIRYMDNGDTFNIDINDIDNLNDLTYPTNIITIIPTDYGITPFSITSAELTDWTSIYNNVNASYSTTSQVNAVDTRTISQVAQIRARPVDWTAGSYVYSVQGSVAIDTYAASSTDINEEFDDEVYRRIQATYGTWDSTSLLSSTDLMIIGGQLQRQYGDWTSTIPSNTADYSGTNTETQVYVRGFKHTGTSHSNGVLDIGGVTETDVLDENFLIWISLDGSDWYKLNLENYGYFDLGDPLWGIGCRINPDTVKDGLLEFTLLTMYTAAGTGPDGWGIYVKIEIPSGQNIIIDHIRITNWA